jgi:recombination protein RecR
LISLKNNVTFCSKCYNLSDDKLCGICNDQERVENQIMVVEDVLDLVAFERTGQYTGKYHVLGGLLSPMQGVGPEDLTIDKLIKRMKNIPGDIELILATSPSLEGEATAMFITEQLHDIPEISITRIARGVPTGADLDYTDKLTLLRALENRTKMPQ